MKRSLMVIGAVLAGVLQSQAYREGDSQLWTVLGADAQVAPSVRLGVETGARWGDSMSDYFYEVAEPGVTWKAQSWLDVGASYEIIRQKKNGDWLDEQVPKVTVTLKGDSGPLQLSNRSRFEYRIREAASDEWRYRDRLRLQLAKGLTEWKLKPFVDDELYYSGDEQLFNENRASAGFGFEPRAWLKAELYYMVRSTLKSNVWTDSNILGVKLGFSF